MGMRLFNRTLHKVSLRGKEDDRQDWKEEQVSNHSKPYTQAIMSMVMKAHSGISQT